MQCLSVPQRESPFTPDVFFLKEPLQHIIQTYLISLSDKKMLPSEHRGNSHTLKLLNQTQTELKIKLGLCLRLKANFLIGQFHFCDELHLS